MRATGLKTKRVELGLRMLLDLNQQVKARDYRGKLMWEGNLDDMRTDRAFRSSHTSA